MSTGSDYQRLRAHLAFLRMGAAAEALPGLLEEARTTRLSHSELLERLLAVEVDAVDERRRSSLARFASLPSPFTLADFDYSAQPSVDPALIAELATLRFVEDATNVLFIGPPGVGKTMLAVGLGTPYLPLPAEAAAALFQVVSQRYLKGSIALTTNLGIASWGKVFNHDPNDRRRHVGPSPASQRGGQHRRRQLPDAQPSGPC